MQKEDEQNMNEEEEEEKPLTGRQKLDLPIAILSLVLLIIALAVPLIICDILGSGAQFFKSYAFVSVSGSSAGNSQATFFFGLDYFFAHWDVTTFIPLQLFTAQWRAIAGVLTNEQGGYATLGMLTLILTFLMWIVSFAETVICFIDRFLHKRAFHQIAKYAALVSAIAEGVTFVYFFVIVLSLWLKVDAFTFSQYDFAAYGGVKMFLEAIFLFVIAVLNAWLFVRLKRHPDELEA